MTTTASNGKPQHRPRLSLRWKAFAVLLLLLSVVHLFFGIFAYRQSIELNRREEGERLNGLRQAFDGMLEQSAQDLGRIAAQVAASTSSAQISAHPLAGSHMSQELLADLSSLRLFDRHGRAIGAISTDPSTPEAPSPLEMQLLTAALHDHRPGSTLSCREECMQLVYAPAFDRDGREIVVGISQPVSALMLAFSRQSGADVALISANPTATADGLFGHRIYAVTNAPTLLPRLRLAGASYALPLNGQTAVMPVADYSYMLLASALPAARDRTVGLFILDERPAMERIRASLRSGISASLCGLLLSSAAIWWFLTPLSRRLRAITRTLPMLAEQRFAEARNALQSHRRQPSWPDEIDVLAANTGWLAGQLEQLHEVEAASAAKSRFLATMSHEVRTPLNGILGLLELLQHSNLDHAQRDSVQMVHESAKSLLRVLDDTLDLARIEAGRIDLEVAPLSIEQVVSGCVETVAGAARNKHIKLVVHVDSTLPDQVVGDAMRLCQVLGNLCSNAIKFTGAGRVLVRAENRGRLGGSVRVRFSVLDTGVGIPEDVQHSLFQPYEQGGGRIAARYGGSGLGLSICHGLIKRMGGRIGFVSTPGVGTEFSFWLELPIAATADKPTSLPLFGITLDVHIEQTDENACLADYLRAAGARIRRGAALRLYEPDALHLAVAEGLTPPCLLTYPVHRPALLRAVASAAGIQQPNAESSIPAAPARRLRILAVDDHPTNREVIKKQLELLGHDPVSVHDGPSALALLGASRFDLLLTDLRMPGMDGIDLVRELRRREHSGTLLGRLPVLALSAHTSPSETEQCLAADMDGCLSKPIGLDGLRQALQRWMPAAPPTQAEPPPAAPAQPLGPLNRDKLLELIGGDADLAESLLADFVGINSAPVAALAHLVSEGDAKALTATTHKLLGSARTICAPALERALEALDQAAQGEDTTQLTTLAAAVTKEFERVRIALSPAPA